MSLRVLLLMALSSLYLESGSADNSYLPQKGKGDVGVKIPAIEASSFLSVPEGHSRARRNAKWYHTMPDFQAYYQYYDSIGHYEGVLEIDRIHQTYLHMLHLEQTYGMDAPYYQNVIAMVPPTPDSKGQTKADSACDPRYDKGCTHPVATPRAEKGPPRQHRRPQCDPQDPQCRRSPLYKGRARLCDPYLDPSCRPVPRQRGPEQKGPRRPRPKVLEYDCDPIYDAECPDSMKGVQRQHRPRGQRTKGLNGPGAYQRGGAQGRRGKGNRGKSRAGQQRGRE
ncbi:uncharacterized protein [Ambystoma mexicanum]|uniref:uncharacterized protein n=1 Tax=Ambystoma mexicanum TaxID=8296 RepID=UPI0037E77345